MAEKAKKYKKGKEILAGVPTRRRKETPPEVVAEVVVGRREDPSTYSNVKSKIMVITRYTPADKEIEKLAATSAGLIADTGGAGCHHAIMAKEQGIPCVSGTMKATKVLKTGDTVFINSDEGKVYEAIEVVEEETTLEKIKRIAAEKGVTLTPELIKKLEEQL